MRQIVRRSLALTTALTLCLGTLGSAAAVESDQQTNMQESAVTLYEDEVVTEAPWGDAEVQDFTVDLVTPGVYAFETTMNAWYSFGTWSFLTEGTADISLWERTESGYQPVHTVDADYGYGRVTRDFRATKGDQYFVWVESDSWDRAYYERDEDGDLYLSDNYIAADVEAGADYAFYNVSPEMPDQYTTITDGETVTIHSSGPDDITWLCVPAGEPGKYEVRYPSEDGNARVETYYARSNGELSCSTQRNRIEGLRFVSGNTDTWLRCNTYEGAADYTVTIKKVTEETETTANYEQAKSLRQSTTAGSIAVPQAQAALDYAEEFYRDSELGSLIDKADPRVVTKLQTIADKITDGLETDREKATAICAWVKKNISYNDYAFSFVDSVIYSGEGDCDGIAGLVRDLCRLSGIDAVRVTGWINDQDANMEEIWDRVGHAWNLIYLDGTWELYDCLWNNYGVIGAEAIAAHGYYSCMIDGMSMLGEGVDPALIGKDSRYASVGIYAYAWIDGTPWYLINGLPGIRYQTIQTLDQDGMVIEYDVRSVPNWFFSLNQIKYTAYGMSYEVQEAWDTLDHTRGYYRWGFSEGDRTGTPQSELFRDGWIADGVTSTRAYYAETTGMVKAYTLFKNGIHTWYADQNGEVVRMGVSLSEYQLWGGNIVVGSDFSGKLFIDPEVEYYRNREGYEIEYVPIDPDTVQVDDDGSITVLGEGNASYEVYVREAGGSGYLTSDIYYVYATDEGRTLPKYDYSGAELDPDDPDPDDPDPTTDPEPETPNFTDVPEDLWYYNAVNWAVEQNVTSGFEDNTFRPDGNCTRAQIVQFLYNQAGKPDYETSDNPFTDVEEDAWYYDAVLWAVEQGITSGMGDGTFGVNNTCTREQAVTFLWNAQGKPGAASTEADTLSVMSEDGFTDVPAGEWYYNSVMWAVEKHVTAGMGDGTFGVGRYCTRAAIVQFLYNLEIN